MTESTPDIDIDQGQRNKTIRRQKRGNPLNGIE